ncbi:MAG: hypothetical protein R6W91_02005, partial [Thermoplasmata archaeon]
SSFALHFINNSERAGLGVFLFSEFFLYSPSQRSEDKEKTRAKQHYADLALMLFSHPSHCIL